MIDDMEHARGSEVIEAEEGDVVDILGSVRRNCDGEVVAL